MFVAKLIGPDGHEDKKLFTKHSDAKAWLTGPGLKKFDGDVERSELWTEDGKLMWWSGTRPKDEDQHYEQMCSDPNSTFRVWGWGSGRQGPE
jgi:hypothetical protein